MLSIGYWLLWSEAHTFPSRVAEIKQTSTSSEDFHFQFSSFTGLFLIFSIPLQSMYFPPSLPSSLSLHLTVLIHSFFQSSIYPFSIISFIFLLDLSFIFVSYTLSSVLNTSSTLLDPYEILTDDHVLDLVLVLLWFTGLYSRLRKLDIQFFLTWGSVIEIFSFCFNWINKKHS